jgi:hypothetical protein
MQLTGNQAHDANLVAAEAQRQIALNPPSLQNHDGRPGIVGILQPPPSAAATLAANIAYFRACRASAIANGVSPASYVMALQELGTGGQ